jgi:lysophospholipase L1-like esterase
MTRHLVAEVLLATSLAVGAGCSSGGGAWNDGAGGMPSSGGTTAGEPSGGGTGGQAMAGQATSGTAGTATAGTGGMPETAGAHSGGGGATTGGASSDTGGTVAAGTNGGGAGGAAGGTGSYAPCPMNGSPCKILPLGDSITHGAKSSNDAGYRSQLFKLIVAANQKVTFTGSLTNGPAQESGQPFPRMHEGHSGWTINQLSPLIPSPGLDGKPSIILLHIGTNDIGSRDPTGMATRLDALVDKLAQNAPDALIVVAQITTARTDNDIRDAYNAKIPGIVQSHAAKGRHIISVDQNKLPMSGLSPDGVHPNDQGYAYMASVWYAAIKNVLPQ